MCIRMNALGVWFGLPELYDEPSAASMGHAPPGSAIPNGSVLEVRLERTEGLFVATLEKTAHGLRFLIVAKTHALRAHARSVAAEICESRDSPPMLPGFLEREAFRWTVDANGDHAHRLVCQNAIVNSLVVVQISRSAVVRS